MKIEKFFWYIFVWFTLLKKVKKFGKKKKMWYNT